ncbi:hypothetical protein VHEMI06634 [[Torrubiella] hemipterigena]|uniref:Uncharacterized protein n=1 Tax=[Torrubiella] hemipterigena TaxID=1531966 RepID=A0A0A1TLF9_9HYPO|nr:hypothetical protein VHEMI06634 [[Torrubiella] hemipterigena]
MKPQFSIIGALCVATSTATPIASVNTGDIKWSPCNFANETVPIYCGKLTVPLDYTKKNSTDVIELDLQRIPASKCAKKGSILFNFGGPGSVGAASFVPFGKILQAITGGEHDLITFAPRGTGKTLPYSCFKNSLYRIPAVQTEAGRASDVAVPDIWAKSTLYDASCYAAQNKTGEFVGTAFVARDMMQIVDALKEDGLLRYWGVSYGTVLGATAVAMFPDRMDKVILDGVVNAEEYYENKEVEIWTDSEDVFRGFCSSCVTNRTSCPIAGNRTSEQLESYLRRAIDDMKQHPIAIPSPEVPGGGVLITYSLVKSILHSSLYNPSQWPGLAIIIDALLRGDILGLGGVQPASGGEDMTGYEEALYGIKCSDMRWHTNNLTEIMPTINARHNKSALFGDVADSMVARCAQWPMSAKEIYRGDFKVTPKNPVLIIGNEHDPVTPLVSARNMTERFQGSVLLEQKSYGVSISHTQ